MNSAPMKSHQREVSNQYKEELLKSQNLSNRKQSWIAELGVAIPTLLHYEKLCTYTEESDTCIKDIERTIHHDFDQKFREKMDKTMLIRIMNAFMVSQSPTAEYFYKQSHSIMLPIIAYVLEDELLIYEAFRKIISIYARGWCGKGIKGIRDAINKFVFPILQEQDNELYTYLKQNENKHILEFTGILNSFHRDAGSDPSHRQEAIEPLLRVWDYFVILGFEWNIIILIARLKLDRISILESQKLALTKLTHENVGNVLKFASLIYLNIDADTLQKLKEHVLYS